MTISVKHCGSDGIDTFVSVPNDCRTDVNIEGCTAVNGKHFLEVRETAEEVIARANDPEQFRKELKATKNPDEILEIATKWLGTTADLASLAQLLSDFIHKL